MELKRDALLVKLGAASSAMPFGVAVSESRDTPKGNKLEFSLRKKKLGAVRRREGRYLLRSMPSRSPKELWEFYLQLVQVEQAFKHLKGDLAIRPIFHHDEQRIEAHIFIAFLAYCVHATLGRRLKDLAPGLTTRAVLEKMAALHMIDVHLPTTDGRTVILTRYTQPETEHRMLLEQLKLTLPDQPPPQITAAEVPPPEAV